ncbi:MAG TPA: cytochrome c biogenesis protein CcdA [Candidatus Baltobacteraceae bacterium]|nr:cytochrome c biogenesis protein CcdA [Candidatus Baltobacteraceae bacterium]
MFDPISQALSAVSSRSAYAAPLVFAAGVVSSIGPCVAPRFIAVAGLTSGTPRKTAIVLIAAFVVGLTLTYAAFGAVSSLIMRAAQFSAYTYWLVAAALAAGGFVTLWRGESACMHRHGRADASAGAALLLGSSFALVVSPCCTPLVVGILAYASAAANAAYASMLLACFALGHAVPVIAVAFGVNKASRFLQRYSVRQAAGVVSGALMLGLSMYYAVLA